MPKKGAFINLAGARFGRLTVLTFVDQKHRAARWLARCDCGREKVIPGTLLRSGRIISCGCSKERHGKSSSALYRRWASMITRCTNPRSTAYGPYGAIGIRVCVRWKRSFSAFLSDMGPPPTPRHTLERIDNRRGYEPGNCRWATRAEQSRNTSRNRWIEADGERLIVADWAKRLGISHSAIWRRLKQGMKPSLAVTVPPRRSSTRVPAHS